MISMKKPVAVPHKGAGMETLVAKIPSGAKFGKNGFNMHARVTSNGGRAVWRDFHATGSGNKTELAKKIVKTVVSKHQDLAKKNGANKQMAETKVEAAEKSVKVTEKSIDLDAEKIAMDAVYEAKLEMGGAKLMLIVAVPLTVIVVAAAITTGTVIIPLAVLAAVAWAYIAYESFVKPKRAVANAMNRQISNLLENQDF